MAAAQALVATLPSRTVAVPLASARRVIARPELTPLPDAPPVVLGLANLRGEVVPVLDTGLLLSDEAVVGARFVIVVDTARGPAGLAVPSLPRPMEVDDAELLDTDSLTAQ